MFISPCVCSPLCSFVLCIPPVSSVFVLSPSLSLLISLLLNRFIKVRLVSLFLSQVIILFNFYLPCCVMWLVFLVISKVFFTFFFLFILLVYLLIFFFANYHVLSFSSSMLRVLPSYFLIFFSLFFCL